MTAPIGNGLAIFGRDFPGVSTICWVNPNIASEQCVAWLGSGAPNETFRRLGYEQPPSKD